MPADDPVCTAPPAAASADVVLFTRAGCHLCQQAEQVVAPVTATRGGSFVTVDVDGDADLRQRFTDHVPVLYVHGRLVDYWQVDAERLERALAGLPVEPRPAL